MNSAAEDLRAEASDWLRQHWDAGARAPRRVAPGEWRRLVVAGRWAAPTWPEAWYGRGLAEAGAEVIEAEFARVGAPGAGQDRTNLFAATLFRFGPESLKRRVLPGALSGDRRFCLLYSEPGAGSDLAAVRTRADRAEDGWRATGQKIWTSGAADADYGFLLARTDWDAPKHQGIGFFLLPMKQPGVTVRPIHQITGDSHFNEVFLDGAAIPADHLLGPENGGWRWAKAPGSGGSAIPGTSSRAAGTDRS
jgi:alkylation response protein AidB-like acyl-CoA dehydrogenase